MAQPVHPIGYRGLSGCIAGETGLDVHHGCAIDSIEPYDPEHVAPSLQEFYYCNPQRVRPDWAACGEHPDKRQVWPPLRVDFGHGTLPGMRSMHPEKDYYVGEVVQAVHGTLEAGIEYNLGHYLLPATLSHLFDFVLDCGDGS